MNSQSAEIQSPRPNSRVLLPGILALIVSLASPVLAGFNSQTKPTAVDSGAASEPAAKTLYLIRHGEYDHEDERDPEVGRGLVPLGVAQARLVAARLAGLPTSFSALHASPMTRARETAAVVAEDLGLEMILSSSLRECTPPTWRQDIMDDETPDDLATCETQIDAAYDSLVTPAIGQESHEIVVGHGNVIRSFVTRALGVDSKAWLGMSIGNCSLTVLHVNPDGSKKILSFSDVGHLPPNLQTRTTPGVPRSLALP